MLTFPTMAERAIAEFRNPETPYRSLVKIAERMGGVRRDIRPQALAPWSVIEFDFDDDTTLRITGRGKGHKIEALLP